MLSIISNGFKSHATIVGFYSSELVENVLRKATNIVELALSYEKSITTVNTRSIFHVKLRFFYGI
jgi:hypothetical protein